MLPKLPPAGSWCSFPTVAIAKGRKSGIKMKILENHFAVKFLTEKGSKPNSRARWLANNSRKQDQEPFGP